MATVPTTIVLLLVYFLKGGLIVTHSTVVHEGLECKTIAPIMADLSKSDQLEVAGRQMQIVHIETACVTVPEQTST